MGTFNVSLKTLTDRVSMEVVYTPRALDFTNIRIETHSFCFTFNDITKSFFLFVIQF